MYRTTKYAEELYDKCFNLGTFHRINQTYTFDLVLSGVWVVLFTSVLLRKRTVNRPDRV